MAVCLVIALYVIAAALEFAGILVVAYYLRRDRNAARNRKETLPDMSARPSIPLMSALGQPIDPAAHAAALYAAKADSAMARDWTSGKRAWAPFLIASGVLVAVAANTAALYV